MTVDWQSIDSLERAVMGRPVNSDTARFLEPPAPFATCATLAPA